LLLGFAVSEDGALHAEKYYRTVTEEFASCRGAFRWRHLAALARVTGSEHGVPAPGYQQARELLKVSLPRETAIIEGPQALGDVPRNPVEYATHRWAIKPRLS